MGWLRLLWPFINLGTAGIEAHKARKLAEIDLQTATLKARASAAMAKAQNEAGWEMLAAEQASSSWKDEFWTVLLAIPLILAFVPGMGPFVKHGFDTLGASVPNWYKWALMAAISFAFARKALPKFANVVKKKST